MDLTTSPTQQVLAQAMAGHYARHQAIASNIANAETPNYQRREVLFKDALKQAVHQQHQGGNNNASNDEPLALAATQPLHFGFEAENALNNLAPETQQGSGFVYRNDANGVDLEQEMVNLSRNVGKFKSLVTLQSRLNQQTKQLLSSMNV